MKMEFQEVKKEKQKIEEDFKKILIEFEDKYGMIVENIEIKRVYETRRDSKILSLGLGLRMK
jgi:S-adenosylmethionine hydrolase